MDADILEEAGATGAEAAVVSTDGDNSNIVIGQILQRRYGIGCVVVRVLDPARAEFYRQRGLRTICPTSVAIDVLLDSVRACEVRPAEPTKA
jgi:trk system potassium uptake protein TrkA